MASIDILIVTTESHRQLALEFFRPSLPDGCRVSELMLDVEGDGRFRSDGYRTGVTAKLQWAIDHIDANPDGSLFILSDVDIQFFEAFSVEAARAALHSCGAEILFQKESRSKDSSEVNTGFYIARASAWTRDLLQRAADACAAAEGNFYDQDAINAVLDPADLGVRWGYLPFSYYARSQGFPPRRDVVIHHANFSGTIPEKTAALARVRRYVDGSLLDKARACAEEFVDYGRSGKLRMLVRSKVARVRPATG